MAGLRAVLFDNDGTLVDTYELLMACFRAATADVLGEALPDAVLSAKIGTPLVEQVKDFSDDPAVQRRIVAAYKRHGALVDDTIRGFPGMTECLQALAAAGLALGVVTSKMHASAERNLALAGAAPYLSCIVSPDDCPQHKPDPGPVLHACGLLGVEAGASAYVGDSPFDIRAGNAAGALTVAVTWGMFSEDVLRAEGPDRVCRSFEELTALLCALAR